MACVGVRLMRHGNRSARYLVTSWLVMAPEVLMYLFTLLSLLPASMSADAVLLARRRRWSAPALAWCCGHPASPTCSRATSTSRQTTCSTAPRRHGAIGCGRGHWRPAQPMRDRGIPGWPAACQTDLQPPPAAAPAARVPAPAGAAPTGRQAAMPPTVPPPVAAPLPPRCAGPVPAAARCGTPTRRPARCPPATARHGAAPRA